MGEGEVSVHHAMCSTEKRKKGKPLEKERNAHTHKEKNGRTLCGSAGDKKGRRGVSAGREPITQEKENEKREEERIVCVCVCGWVRRGRGRGRGDGDAKEKTATRFNASRRE